MAGDLLDDGESERLAANGPRVSALYLQYASVAYARRSEFQAWEHYAFAALARAHYALESIFILRDREADQAALTRVVYEHVITFAWLMIDPPTHYLQLLSWEHGERQKMRDDIERFSTVPGLTEAQLTLLMRSEGYDPTAVPARGTPDRALAADKHWAPLVPEWSFRMRHGYASVFRPHSVNVHPTLMGLMAFSSRDENARAGEPKRLLKLRLDAEAVAIFGDALIVASQAFGWPSKEAVIHAVFDGVET